MNKNYFLLSLLTLVILTFFTTSAEKSLLKRLYILHEQIQNSTTDSWSTSTESVLMTMCRANTIETNRTTYKPSAITVVAGCLTQSSLARSQTQSILTSIIESVLKKNIENVCLHYKKVPLLNLDDALSLSFNFIHYISWRTLIKKQNDSNQIIEFCCSQGITLLSTVVGNLATHYNRAWLEKLDMTKNQYLSYLLQQVPAPKKIHKLAITMICEFILDTAVNEASSRSCRSLFLI